MPQHTMQSEVTLFFPEEPAAEKHTSQATLNLNLLYGLPEGPLEVRLIEMAGPGLLPDDPRVYVHSILSEPRRESEILPDGGLRRKDACFALSVYTRGSLLPIMAEAEAEVIGKGGTLIRCRPTSTRWYPLTPDKDLRLLRAVWARRPPARLRWARRVECQVRSAKNRPPAHAGHALRSRSLSALFGLRAARAAFFGYESAGHW